MFVECKFRYHQILLPESSIKAVVLEDQSLHIHTTDGDVFTLTGSRSQIWEAYSQIRNGLERLAYRVDLTWLAESPAPEGVATGD